MSSNPRVPVLQTEPAKPALFERGSRVFLKSCPFGEPGRVQKTERGRVLVRWSSPNYLGRHHPKSLLLADEVSNDDQT